MDVAAVALRGLFQRGSTTSSISTLTSHRRKKDAAANEHTQQPLRAYRRDVSLYDQLLLQDHDQNEQRQEGQGHERDDYQGHQKQEEDGDDDDEEREEEDDDEEEDQESTSASNSSVASSTPALKGQKVKKRKRNSVDSKLSREDRRYLTRRKYLCPQGAWPILRPAAQAAAAPASTTTSSFVTQALPEDIPFTGVRHYIPRIYSTAAAAAAAASDHQNGTGVLEWLPMENLHFHNATEAVAADAAVADASSSSPDPSSLYPVPSPVVARLLDETILKKMARTTSGRPRSGGNDDGEGKIYLSDLVKGASDALSLPGEQPTQQNDDDNDGEQEREDAQKRKKTKENVQILRQCLGREVERMIDSLLDYLLSYWAEREHAHRSDPDYRARLQEKRAKAAILHPARRKSIDDVIAFGNRSLTLGDWRDMLQAVESKAAVESALDKSRAEKEKAEERCFLKWGKKKKKKRKTKDQREQEKKEEAREESRLLLRPVLAPDTRHRTYNRLEALFHKQDDISKARRCKEMQRDGTGKKRRGGGGGGGGGGMG